MISSKKFRLVKVLSLFLFSMFIGGVFINLFYLSNFLAFNQSEKTQIELFANGVKKLMAEEHFASLSIEHEDLTGVKSLIRKKRNIVEPNTAAPARLAVYNPQSLPVIPVQYQAILDSATRADIRANITAVSKQYLGRPYVYAAKGPNAFDCSGYTSYIMRLFGIGVSPSSRHQALQGKHVDLDKATVGDLLFFSRSGKGGIVTHVGLILSNGPEGITVIHANGPGIMIENVSQSSYWRNKILFARDVISTDKEAKILAEK